MFLFMLTFDEVLGQRLAEMRLGEGWSKAHVADRARRWGGLRWTRLTVAQIEAGERRLTAAELFTLPLVFNLSVADIIGGIESEEFVQLGPDGAASVNYITSKALTGDFEAVQLRYLRKHIDVPEIRAVREVDFKKIGDNLRDLIRVLSQAGFHKVGDVSDQLLETVNVASTGEAEQAAARNLGIDPRLVAALSFRLWGHGLTKERDNRVAKRGEEISAPSRQAMRGHVTRGLLKELQELIDEGSE